MFIGIHIEYCIYHRWFDFIQTVALHSFAFPVHLSPGTFCRVCSTRSERLSYHRSNCEYCRQQRRTHELTEGVSYRLGAAGRIQKFALGASPLLFPVPLPVVSRLSISSRLFPHLPLCIFPSP